MDRKDIQLLKSVRYDNYNVANRRVTLIIPFQFFFSKGVVKDIKSLYNLLLWKMVWEKSPDCQMNHNIKQIIDALKVISVQENFERVINFFYCIP